MCHAHFAILRSVSLRLFEVISITDVYDDCRLEAYDRNANFMEADDIITDDNDWKMDIPEAHTFRDVTSSSCLPPISQTDVASFLQPHNASIDTTARELYNAR